MRRIIIDLDNTLTAPAPGIVDYETVPPEKSVVSKLREYRHLGFTIVIYTSRNMRTHNGNVGLINVHTLPIVLAWLREHDVPFDEVIVGKPWCGEDGFYVDDRAIRPDEFVNLTPSEIEDLLDPASRDEAH